MAFKFIRRHKRKSIATGSFIVVGISILIIMQGFITGINDTMVINTTRLHYGDLYTSFVGADKIDETIRKIKTSVTSDTILVRYQFTGVGIFKDNGEPLQCYGVNTEDESKTTAISKKIVSGRYPQKMKHEILIGEPLAKKLMVNLGSIISLMDKRGKSIGKYRVSGIFKTGIVYVDKLAAFLPESTISESIKITSKIEISVFLNRHDNVEKYVNKINSELKNGIKMKSWMEILPDLVQVIDLNKTSMMIIMLFVYLLVGFGIGNNFILTIMERFKEIGILKSMGVTPREVKLLIFLESFILCFIAVFFGAILGILITFILSNIGIDFSILTSHNQYFVVSSIIYPRISFYDILISVIFAFTVSIITAFIPTRVVSKKIAIQALRF